MSITEALKDLGTAVYQASARKPLTGTRVGFTLTRGEQRRPCAWTWNAGHAFCLEDESGMRELPASYDAATAVGAFVEEVEADSLPEGEVPEGFEVWRFDRASMTRDADLQLARALCAVLDEAFNEPSLYDGRDLREAATSEAPRKAAPKNTGVKKGPAKRAGPKKAAAKKAAAKKATPKKAPAKKAPAKKALSRRTKAR